MPVHADRHFVLLWFAKQKCLGSDRHVSGDRARQSLAKLRHSLETKLSAAKSPSPYDLSPTGRT